MVSEILTLGQPGGPEGWVLLLLAAVALAAGFVDAVVGGGGLVAIPALFSFVPQGSPATLFGTNKIAAISGTFVAATRYARSVRLPWNAVAPALVGAAIFGWLGAAAVSFLPR
ncbi:MAG: TSUP family transporter, partial [Burkholderiaceae bacterium]